LNKLTVPFTKSPSAFSDISADRFCSPYHFDQLPMTTY